MSPDKFSISSRVASFRFAFRGITRLFKNEPNAIIHLVAAVVATCAGIILGINRFEWCLIAIVAGLVIIAEIFNTSIENLGDAIDPNWNEKIMKAKDLAAAGVLVAAIISVITGLLIFVPRIIALVR
ncbi:MAG TPA: diacylglycerol kinase family protein [Bacteroidales bacterium]|jgi:diacylglycerol kinase|nr:diacylglycerol kinase family protein [Bacteroidales bacterium]HOW10578.1 diacylglycerol kinase family protein [Bacteroidales bacterium]